MGSTRPDATGEPDLDELVVLKIWALTVAFERRLATELGPLGISVASFRLIGELLREPDGVRQSELARRLGVRPPSVSSAVTRLERDGLVHRVEDPDDTRARRVRLSPDASLRPGLDLLGRLESILVDDLDEADRDLLGRQLDGLKARLEATS